MDVPVLREKPLGVYVRSGDHDFVPVHVYGDGDYTLAEIVEVFGVGNVESVQEGICIIVLSRNELRRLRVSADAYSFDYDPEFIEMCVALYEYGQSSREQTHHFIANFD